MTGRSLRYNFKIEAIEWIKKIALGCLRFFKKRVGKKSATGLSLRYNFKIEAIEWIKKIALGCLWLFKKVGKQAL